MGRLLQKGFRSGSRRTLLRSTWSGPPGPGFATDAGGISGPPAPRGGLWGFPQRHISLHRSTGSLAWRGFGGFPQPVEPETAEPMPSDDRAQPPTRAASDELPAPSGPIFGKLRGAVAGAPSPENLRARPTRIAQRQPRALRSAGWRAVSPVVGSVSPSRSSRRRLERHHGGRNHPVLLPAPETPEQQGRLSGFSPPRPPPRVAKAEALRNTLPCRRKWLPITQLNDRKHRFRYTGIPSHKAIQCPGGGRQDGAPHADTCTLRRFRPDSGAVASPRKTLCAKIRDPCTRHAKSRRHPDRTARFFARRRPAA